MDKKIVFLFPGQGAQYVGMARDLYENFPQVKELFDRADEILGEKISQILFEGPEDRLKQTQYCQLAIYLHSYAIFSLLPKELKPYACAGLSLGEYTAMAAAGVFSFEEGLRLVQKRAQFMQQAAEQNPGTLAAVLNLEPDQIEAVLKNHPEVWIANLNCPGQVVIGGSLSGIEAIAEPLKAAGARRVLPLAVSGAFHTPLMESAALKLQPFIQSTPFSELTSQLVMNVTGDFVTDETTMREALFEQVMSPVYFEKGLRKILKNGIHFIVEMGPGKTISGMVKKINPEIPLFSIDKASDLETVLTALGSMEE